MLNFTGQSRRRNINLGNRSGTSKHDVLIRAQQERERRAQDRQQEEAVKVLQSNIRKYKVTARALSEWSSNLSDERSYHLIPAFGSRLYDYLLRSSLSQLLKSSQKSLAMYSGYLGNLQLFALISKYDDDTLLIDTLNCINIHYPTPKALGTALVSFLKKTKSLGANSVCQIIHMIQVWDLNCSDEISTIFELNTSEAASSRTILEFYKILASSGILPSSKENSSLMLENLSYIYFNVDQHRDILERRIAQCFKNMDYKPTNLGLHPYVIKLYEMSFIDKIANMVEKEVSQNIDMDTIIGYMNCASQDDSRDSILIALLSRPTFLKKIYINLKKSAFEVNQSQPSTFFIFVKLLEMHLLVSTDHELLSEGSGFTVQDLIEFTTNLKDFVFNNIWRFTIESRPDVVETAIPLLQKLYLRDSRLHFCSSKADPHYWHSDDPEFLNVSPFKYIEDYERLYRDYADRKEDMFSDTDTQNGTDEFSSIKYKIFQQLSSSYRNSVSTRQFKKLEILIKVPFFIPFEQRVNLFYMFIAIDKQRLRLDDDSVMMGLLMPWNHSGFTRQSATISRENILEDACNAFNSIGERFKAKLAVTFVNEFGPEAGIDGGGITKEFLTSVSEEGFNGDKYDLFQTTDQHELYPSTHIDPQKLRYLWFLGKILGKCLYDHVLIDVTFADFFVKKILNYSSRFTSSFDDLYSLDGTLYSNLVKLLSMSAKEIESLDLYFDINSDTNTSQVIELIPNGSSTQVKKSNVLLYIFKVADFKLNRSLSKQIRNFHGGMSLVIAPHWMEMFNSVELQMLISGGGKDIDLKDLKDNTEYGGYLGTDKSIEDFWEILREFSPQERLKFIKFVTSVPRAPLQGFASLEPKFGIRNAGRELDRLPTASTCVNLLKLPDYQNKELLRQKLLYAINSGARFDLS